MKLAAPIAQTSTLAFASSAEMQRYLTADLEQALAG